MCVVGLGDSASLLVLFGTILLVFSLSVWMFILSQIVKMAIRALTEKGVSDDIRELNQAVADGRAKKD
jgi:hypothetical protein